MTKAYEHYEGMLYGRKCLSHHKVGVNPRYTVYGVEHPKGAPIRFKSLERAERHIINMKLQVQEAKA